MGTLGMNEQRGGSDQAGLVEQRRLEALLDLTTKHSKQVQSLKSQLEQAETKAAKATGQVKGMENELKTLRAQNPDRMKKQIKRLQEQNRLVVTENNTLKTKQKQIQQQLDATKKELEESRSKDAEKEKDAAKSTDAKSSGSKKALKKGEKQTEPA